MYIFQLLSSPISLETSQQRQKIKKRERRQRKRKKTRPNVVIATVALVINSQSRLATTQVDFVSLLFPDWMLKVFQSRLWSKLVDSQSGLAKTKKKKPSHFSLLEVRVPSFNWILFFLIITRWHFFTKWEIDSLRPWGYKSGSCGEQKEEKKKREFYFLPIKRARMRGNCAMQYVQHIKRRSIRIPVDYSSCWWRQTTLYSHIYIPFKYFNQGQYWQRCFVW